MPHRLSQLFKDTTTSLHDAVVTRCLGDGVHTGDMLVEAFIAFTVWKRIVRRMETYKSRRKSLGKRGQLIAVTM